MPPWIEQRARAFAGEFLLPGQVAADLWEQEGGPTDKAGVERVLREVLCVRYGVTMAVASYKLQHGLGLHSQDPLVGILNELAPYR
jgi:Zn-dependent peptidase ImmA (M78 family)